MLTIDQLFGYELYYDRETRLWWGFWKNREGNQLHEAVAAHHRDDVLLTLGGYREESMQATRLETRNEI